MVDTPDPSAPNNDPVVTELQNLANILNGGFQQLEDKLVDSLDKVQDKAEKGNGEGKKRTKGILATAKDIPLVGKAVKLGADQVTAAVKESLKVQKDALARGMNLSKIVERGNIGIANSIGSNIGTTAKLNVAMEKVEAGIGTNVGATNQLAYYTKLTGGDSRKLLKGLGEMGVGMSMSADQEAKLSNSMVSLSQGFGLTTEELMNTIKGMEKSMPMLKMLNIAPEIMEASTRLGAALGQESGQMAADLMNSMMSAEGAIIASQLGVTAEREALLRGEGDATRNALNMVKAAGQEANSMYESYLAGSGDPAIAYKAVEDALGPAMAQSALTYRQLEKQAKEQGMSLDSFLDKVEKQKQISQEFTNTFENLKNAVFAPLQAVMTKLMEGVTAVSGFLLNSPVLLGLIQVLVLTGTAIASLIVAVNALTLTMSIGSKAKAAAGGVKGLFGLARGGAGAKAGAAAGKATGAGAAAVGGGAGSSLRRLGAGMSGLGKGFGRMMQKGLEGVANGLRAMGKGPVMKGVLTIGLLALALIPMAFALSLMKGVGLGSLVILGLGLIGLAVAASLIGAATPAVLMGAAAIAILSLALIPLGIALVLAGAGFNIFAQGLSLITPTQVASLLGLTMVLPLLAASMMAFTGAGILGAVGSWLGGDKFVDNIVKMGGAAKHINKMAKSLKKLPSLFERTTKAMAQISLGPFYMLSLGLMMVKAALDKYGVADMAKLALLSALGPKQSPAQKATPKPEPTGMKSLGTGRVTHGDALGIPTERLTGHERQDALVDQAHKSYAARSNPNDKQAELAFLHSKKAILNDNALRAKTTHTKRDDQRAESAIRANNRQIALLEELVEAVNNGTSEQLLAEREKKRLAVEESMRTHRPMGAGTYVDPDDM